MLELRNATKVYRNGGREIRALDDVSVRLEPGDFAVVHGPSGSGKSTLLLLAGGMLAPDAGAVRFAGQDIYRWSPARLNGYRNRTVGFVFQRFHLLPYLSVADNIRLPLSLARRSARQTGLVEAVAENLQLTPRLGHRPGQLSVGEQQRVAVARAIIGGKKLVCADEPTGNLDARNAEIVTEALKKASAGGAMVLMVTHDTGLLQGGGPRKMRLCEGRLVESGGREPSGT